MIRDKKGVRLPLHLALVVYIILAMLGYAIARFLFFALNHSYFADTSWNELPGLMAGGIPFDLSAMLYTNILFIALLIIPLPFRYNAGFQKFLKGLFLFVNGVTLAVNLSDIIYYRFTLRRTTWSIFQEFKGENVGNLGSSFLLDYWYVPLGWLVIMVLLYKAYSLIKLKKPTGISPWLLYPAHTVLMVLIAGLSVAGMRGGFTRTVRPITLSNAGAYVNRPAEVSVVLNTPFSMLRTIKGSSLERKNHYTEQASLERVYTPVHKPRPGAKFTNKNVIVLVLESFSAELMGSFNGQQLAKAGYNTFTPFLDSLARQGHVFKHSVANGRKSISALPSAISSIPSLNQPFVLTTYAANNKLSGLPGILKEEGYHTSFFHGAPNGSMGFEAYMNLVGVQEYYGMAEYSNDDDFDGLWGIWDEEFLQFFGHKLNQTKEPFMSTLFTVSSHHPFNIPDRYKAEFKEGPAPIARCMQYTDMALQKFFAQAKKQPWFNNTLFVITADHVSGTTYFPEAKTAWGAYSIPIIFYAPGDSSLAGRSNRIVQQLDIMPTVLDYLNYEKPYVAFGKSVLDSTSANTAIHTNSGAYQWYHGDWLLQHDGSRAIGLYNYQVDKFLKESKLEQETELAKKLEQEVLAFVQQYNNRILDNKLVVE